MTTRSGQPGRCEWRTSQLPRAPGGRLGRSSQPAPYKLKVSEGAYGRRKDSVQHLRPLLPLTFERITAGVVDDLFTDIGATHPKTGRVVSETFKMVTREARARGQRIVPEALEVKPPRYRPGEKTFLTLQRAERFAGLAADPHIRNAVRFAFLTGVRQHELLNLQDTDVSLGERSVTVRKSKTAAGSRTVPLAREAQAIVREQRRLRVGGRAGSRFIFPAPRGGRWDKRNFNRAFASVVKAAGESITFHDLRHSFASLMIASECHPKMLQTLLGHKSIQITMDTYGHLYEGADQAAIKRLDQFLADAAAPSAPHERAGEEAV